MRNREDCPHLRPNAGAPECGLAALLAGVPISVATREGHDPCGVCCRLHADAPTEERPGPVVASLVRGAARDRGDQATLDRLRPHLLRAAPSRPIPAGLPDTLRELFPAPRARTRPQRPVGWAVGVMVAPRLQGRDYLPATLAAIAAAGWPDPWIFAEPGAVVPDGAPNVVRWPGRLGCWAAHRTALTALHTAATHAACDAFLLFEDDAHPCPGLRPYLEEHVLWPSGRLAGLNLFLSSSRADGEPGWVPGFWGGQALLLSRESAAAYLGDAAAARQVYEDDLSKDRNGDAAILQWGHRTGRRWWIARGRGGASLVAHRGFESSIWHHATLSGARRERLWAGDVLARRPTAPVPIPQLAEVRLEICSTCPKWQHGACRCNLPHDRIDRETVERIDLACPMNKWPTAAPVEA